MKLTAYGLSTKCAPWLVVAFSAVFIGCTTPAGDATGPAVRPEDARTLIVRLLPTAVVDRAGWAADIYAALMTLDISPTPENVCAVLAVTEQESTFRSDPRARLAAIAWQKSTSRRSRRCSQLAVAAHCG